MNRRHSKYGTIILFLLPGLLLFVGVLIAPIIMSTYYSFFDWNGMGAKTFVGLDNYKELFTSTQIEFGQALLNSTILVITSCCIQLPLALLLALKLGKGVKGERFFLSVYFMPVLISTVVIGQLWLKIYKPDNGILNGILALFGIEGKIWLGPETAMKASLVPVLWQYVGYHMLLMYAGVKSVPPELREAAAIDGASERQVNWHIVIPYIKPILRISVIFAVTGSFKSFDLFYVLTKGKVAFGTQLPSTLLVDFMFSRSRYGMGSAIAVFLIIICFVFAVIINRLFRKED